MEYNIGKAALKCAKNRWGDSQSQHAMAKLRGTFYGFQQGVKWHKNSIWHDKGDFPEIGRKVLVAFVDGFYVVWDVKPETKLSFILFNIKMWCYIDDLLPDAAPTKKGDTR